MGKVAWSKTIEVSDSQAHAMMERAEELKASNPYYHVFSDNCTDFDRDILKAGGVQYPGMERGMLPENLIPFEGRGQFYEPGIGEGGEDIRGTNTRQSDRANNPRTYPGTPAHDRSYPGHQGPPLAPPAGSAAPSPAEPQGDGNSGMQAGASSEAQTPVKREQQNVWSMRDDRIAEALAAGGNLAAAPAFTQRVEAERASQPALAASEGGIAGDAVRESAADNENAVPARGIIAARMAELAAAEDTPG